MENMGGTLPKSKVFQKWYIEIQKKYSSMTTAELLEVVFKWAEPNESILSDLPEYAQYEFDYVKNLICFRLHKIKAL